MASNYAKQQMVRMETFAKFPYLLEINHEIYGTFRYANADEDIEFEGKVYQAGMFEITPPERKDNTISDATLTISGIDQFWIEKIRNAKDKRATAKFTATIMYDNDMNIETVEAIEELDFVLTRAIWDNGFAISWTMTFDEGMSIIVPCDVATSQKVPACK